MTIEIFYTIIAIMFGILGYLHYTIDKQRKEISALWIQIAILASATAKYLTEIENKIENENRTEDRQ